MTGAEAIFVLRSTTIALTVMLVTLRLFMPALFPIDSSPLLTAAFHDAAFTSMYHPLHETR